MSVDKPWVCWFDDCRKDMVEQVGGKCSSLGELINAGIRVPPGFAITVAGYQHFMSQSNILNEIDGQLEGVDPQDIETLEAISAEIRSKIEMLEIDIEFEDQIAEFYRQLSVRSFMPATPVAVRSSATAEDLPGASFAGQQDTYLWVRGIDEVMIHIRRCISSLFTARAIAYRIDMGFDHREVGISVGIQKMANSFAAGVLFTLNPSNGDRSSIVVDSSFGFGESVVSGEVTPDQFLISKVSMEVLSRTISDKKVCYTVNLKKQVSVKCKVPKERRKVQSITDKELIELAQMGKLIEQHYDCPMDVEWAIDKDMPQGGKIFILQARPETVWSNKEVEAVSAAGAGSSAMDHILNSMMAGKKIN